MSVPTAELPSALVAQVKRLFIRRYGKHAIRRCVFDLQGDLRSRDPVGRLTDSASGRPTRLNVVLLVDAAMFETLTRSSQFRSLATSLHVSTHQTIRAPHWKSAAELLFGSLNSATRRPGAPAAGNVAERAR
jgi:hypothetical protein